MRILEALVVMTLAACGNAELTGSGNSTGGSNAGGTAGGTGGGAAGGFAGGAAGGAAGGVAGGATAGGGIAGGGAAGGAAVDPCPTLQIPSTCFGGRRVVFREWGPNAMGDGSYFASQAPSRLGFNRLQDTVWIVKFRLEIDNYLGTVSAYGDSVGGMAWISDQPCDPAFAVQKKLMAWSNHGGGSLNFIVTRDAADAAALAADTRYKLSPQLEGGRCYYAVFENWASYPQSWPPSASDFDALPDGCGNASDPSCYYLAFDFGHRLHTESGQLIAGRVLPGYTRGP